MQPAPRLVHARAEQGHRWWWEIAVVLVLGLLLVPLTAALTAAEDDAALAATTGPLAVDPAIANAPQPPRTPTPAASAAATPTPVAAASGPAAALSRPPSGSAVAPGVETPAVRQIVGLGDSVPAGSACDCSDYVSLLAQRLGKDVTSTNLAVPGQTSSGLLDQLSSSEVRTALAGADVVVVTIGANDVEATDPSDCHSSDGLQCYKDELAALTQNLDRVATSVASLATRPGARILLTGYWNVFLDGTAAKARGADYVRVADAVTREVNARISAAAGAHGAVFVDLFTPFRGADGTQDCTTLLADDGDHPDAAGHALIARTLLAAL